MARLPTIGGDLDNWGTILNQFLSVHAASDGRLFVTNPTTTAVPLTVQGAASQTADLMKIQSSAAVDYLAVAATGKVTMAPTTYVEIKKDASALDYTGTRAALVLQQRDTASAALNEVAPGAMFQFVSTGNGSVVAASHASSSVWAGLWSTMTKSGDASGHCFTGTGQLGAIGAGGYNELGGFQGEFTNTGSTLGAISGVEVVLKDGTSSSTHWDTQMSGVTSRLVKWDSGRTNKWTANFVASSEGTVAPDAILTVNDTGFQNWVVGIDLTKATFTSGVAMRLKNNNSLQWLDGSAAAQTIFFVDAINQTHLRPAAAAANVKIFNYAGTAGITVQGAATPTVDLTDGVHLTFGTTTGTKIGTATTQKIGFWNVAPVVRPTGWGAPTGTPTRTTFATSTVTLPLLAERVKALIDDLTTIGLIGA